MDWKHIESLTPTALNEESKDELLNTIAWYDIEHDNEVDYKRSKILLKLCQEILKYKSEQVDALLAELDEIAVKQAENEVRKESDYESSSYRSKKSDIDDLDYKYRELKLKNKKLHKVIEKNANELDKLNKRIKSLEQERSYLQNEIQQQHHDDSNSDISEAIKDQHKDLIDNIQQKNNQISGLLTDIENVEGDNLQLRAKLIALNEELNESNDILTRFREENEVYTIKIESVNDQVSELKAKNESLQAQIDDILNDKQKREEEFNKFTKEIDIRVDEWKKILDDKNNEIARLKEKQLNQSRASSSLSLKSDSLNEINKLEHELNGRDAKIIELQTHLEKATREMDLNTNLLKKLASDNEMFTQKIDANSLLIKDLKKKLKSSHNRCQQLHDEIKHQNELIRMKSDDLERLIDGSSHDIEVKKLLKNEMALKTNLKQSDKRIADLVRACNKLESANNELSKENLALRDRLGLNEDEYVGVAMSNQQQRKERRLIGEYKAKLAACDEELINQRLEMQKLNKILSKLTQQLCDLGEIPVIHETPVRGEAKRKTSIDQVDTVDSADVIEENDALRKGLHEILESIHNKQETSTCVIKSETLEKLLRALDVKHVAGWYHPAMRLQAELHTLQGTNAELREQLRQTREELEKSKDLQVLDQNIVDEESCNAVSFLNLNKHLLNVLKNYHLEEETNANLIKKLEDYKDEFVKVQEQVNKLYNQYINEKTQWEDELTNVKEQKFELDETNATLQTKIETFESLMNDKNDCDTHIKKAVELAGDLARMNRKLIYWENVDKENCEKIAKLQEELTETKLSYDEKLLAVDEKCMQLEVKLKLSDENSNIYVKSTQLNKLQADYDDLLIKERKLMASIDEVKNFNMNELELLKKQVALLTTEKEELQQLVNSDEEDKVTANELKERQRANHTNSLYELVKEQLEKSEERSRQLQKYNSEIIQNNLMLQENVKLLENKLVNIIDENTYEDLQNKYLTLLNNSENNIAAFKALTEKLQIKTKECEDIKLQKSLEQYHFLSLKHQIVDLQAQSDDKSVIARLSSDVVIARTAEAENNRKYELLQVEFDNYKEENVENCNKSEEAKRKLEFKGLTDERKIRNLEQIIQQQRKQYFGCVPLTTQTKYFDKIVEIYNEKQEIYEKLRQIETHEHDLLVSKQQNDAKSKLYDELLGSKGGDSMTLIQQWFNDKSNHELMQIRLKRQAEFKEMQLNEALQRINKQEEQIIGLEKELLEFNYNHIRDEVENKKSVTNNANNVTSNNNINNNNNNNSNNNKTFSSIAIQAIVQDNNCIGIQTSFEQVSNDDLVNENVVKLEKELVSKNEQCDIKDKLIMELKTKIAELEMNVNLFRQQLGDKQSQIIFYERHIIELQEKKEVHNANSTSQEQFKIQINDLKAIINEKEVLLLKYQALLKKDRDEHSLAAARFQEELKVLQNQLLLASQKPQQEDRTDNVPGRQVIEFYIQQVHSLEKHTNDLHTTVATLNSQLESSREESVRWRTLANERLTNVDEMRISLEEQHRNELEAYKVECEKWRSEVRNLQMVMGRYKKDICDLRPDIEKEMKEKDNRIHELSVIIRQLKTELRRKLGKSQQSIQTQDENFEDVKENLIREHDVLKKRFEQLMNREKSAREEIRSLKGQLMKRPLLSARSDNTNTKEQQFQKKVTGLEREVDELKAKLERESALNEAHKLKVSEDFDRWNKQKSLQQTCDKQKAKLKEKQEECDKLQQTCDGYRMLIERLEREKHSITVKSAKQQQIATNVSLLQRCESLERDNARLLNEIGELKVKLGMQQHHAGGLGAAMLQDKLEAQERKIAVLEMAAKGGVGELRSEIERLQSSSSAMQKDNLRLEADNLELRLEVERSCKELPHLREQLVHLENYVEALKAENHNVTNAGDHGDIACTLPSTSSSSSHPQQSDVKRVCELERTVFVLKRIIEKLQAENKRLINSTSESSSSKQPKSTNSNLNIAERLRRENNRIKEQNAEHMKKIARLELEVSAAQGNSELNKVKEELRQKIDLLDKVKVLLHKAAAKEKLLVEKVKSMNAFIVKHHLEFMDDQASTD